MFRRDNATKIALERLEEDLQTLRAVVGELESAIRTLELEWIETYDKVRHQLSRMAKRGTLPATQDLVQNDAPVDTGEPQIDPISASIHARRARSFLTPREPEE